MSRVYKRPTPSGKVRWWVCVTYRGQRHREVAGDSKKDALKRLRELEDRLDRGKDVTPKKVPFDFLCEEYLRWTEVNLAPRTRKERKFAINAHLKPFFRGLVTDIDVRSIEAYKSKRMAAGIAPVSMNSELKVLSCIFKFGAENNYLEASGENLLVGGADPIILGMIPADLTVKDNYFFKLSAFQKPLLEAGYSLLKLRFVAGLPMNV